MSNIEVFNESVHDKHLFKAVLMAGAPGSGKSTIVKELADVYSDSNFHFANKDNRLDKSDKVFKYGAPTYTISNENIALVNSDDIFEYLLTKNGLTHKMSDDPESELFQKQQGLRKKAKNLIAKKRLNYIEGMLPLVIDGTGAKFDEIVQLTEMLEAEGYDVYMVYVDVELETSQARNKMRVRSVAPDVVEGIWTSVRNNKEKYEAYFGDKFFYEYNDTIEQDPDEEPKSEEELRKEKIKRLRSYGRKIFNSPLENPIGKKKIKDAMAALKRK